MLLAAISYFPSPFPSQAPGPQPGSQPSLSAQTSKTRSPSPFLRMSLFPVSLRKKSNSEDSDKLLQPLLHGCIRLLSLLMLLMNNLLPKKENSNASTYSPARSHPFSSIQGYCSAILPSSPL